MVSETHLNIKIFVVRPLLPPTLSSGKCSVLFVQFFKSIFSFILMKKKSSTENALECLNVSLAALLFVVIFRVFFCRCMELLFVHHRNEIQAKSFSLLFSLSPLHSVRFELVHVWFVV